MHSGVGTVFPPFFDFGPKTSRTPIFLEDDHFLSPSLDPLSRLFRLSSPHFRP